MKRAVFFLLLLAAVQAYAQDARLKKGDLEDLANRMTGIFSCLGPAGKDGMANGAVLHVKQIWNTQNNGRWLYAEQAEVQHLQEPYRQTVYHIYQQDNYTLVCKVYELRNPGQYTAAWKDDNKLYQLTEDALTEAPGCTLYLHKNKEGDFTGATNGKNCVTAFNGAGYTTTEISIYKDKLLNWGEAGTQMESKCGEQKKWKSIY